MCNIILQHLRSFFSSFKVSFMDALCPREDPRMNWGHFFSNYTVNYVLKKIYFLKNWATDSSFYYGSKRKNLNSSRERDKAGEPNYAAETVQISAHTPNLRTMGIVMNDHLPWKPSVSSPQFASFSEGGHPRWTIKRWWIAPFFSLPRPEVGAKIKPFIFIFLKSFPALMNVFMRREERKE